MNGLYRNQVLSLYKQILRLSKSWKAISGRIEDTAVERLYIRSEAQKLFRKNANESSPEKIKNHIKEAETRLGLAQHYGIPYPRLEVAGLKLDGRSVRVSDTVTKEMATSKKDELPKRRPATVWTKTFKEGPEKVGPSHPHLP